MERRGRAQLPAVVEALRGRVAEWRRDRKERGAGARMPEPLWKAAAQLAKVHGLNPVARALGLDYYNLKRRVEGGDGTATPSKPAQPHFVELNLPARAGSQGFVLELEARDGAKLTARLPDSVELDLVALAETFWRRRR